MEQPIRTPPWWHARGAVSSLMSQVGYALIPGVVVYVWFFGWAVVVHGLLATGVALTCEASMLRLRGQPIRPFLTDGSAVVTALLLALALPPLAPWWTTVIGTAFAIVLVKHLYGGLGYNPFNPAMAGYVMLLVSFPLEMTMWPAPASVSGHHLGILESLRVVFLGTPGSVPYDAIAGATPLDLMKTELGLDLTVSEIRSTPIFGDFGGRGWEWMGNAFFLGGAWLIYRRVISWHVPVAMLVSLFVMAMVFHLDDPDGQASPLFHVFSGGAMLGAFFIATDPVSGAATPLGRLIFGAGVGLLTYIIRTWGSYPDGVAFAVLLMNMAVPTIDHYTQPRVYGHPRG